jgi:putative transposase
MFRKQEHKNLCERILHDVASRHNITIEELSVMPDHIHAVVSIPPTMSISQAFHLLKGASAHELFKQKPNFRKRYPSGHFWSPGKFYRSVGDADVETVVKYVQDQRLTQTTLDHNPMEAKKGLTRSPGMNRLSDKSWKNDSEQ